MNLIKLNFKIFQKLQNISRVIFRLRIWSGTSPVEGTLDFNWNENNENKSNKIQFWKVKKIHRWIFDKIKWWFMFKMHWRLFWRRKNDLHWKRNVSPKNYFSVYCILILIRMKNNFSSIFFFVTLQNEFSAFNFTWNYCFKVQ